MPFTAVSALVAKHMDLCLKQAPTQWSPIPQSLFSRLSKLLEELPRCDEDPFSDEQIKACIAAIEAFQSRKLLDKGTLSALRDFFQALKTRGENQITERLS